MSTHRPDLTRAILVLIAPLVLLAVQCGGSESSRSCADGTEGCTCTPGGACDPGLVCLSGYCVDRGSGTGGGGAQAGAGGTGGTGAQSGGGTGGTGGTGAQAGTGATSSTGAQAGAGATGGTGAEAGAAGSAQAGAGGGALQLDPCTGSDDCGPDEICVYDVDGNGSCIIGSQQPCSADLTCIKDMGFLPVTGIEGDFCERGGDCQVDDGHIVGVCVDTAGDGSDHRCVPICQYVYDFTDFACATHPLLGVRQDCSRSNIRAFLAVAMQTYCASAGSVQSVICLDPAPANSISSAFEWTIDCSEQATTCGLARTCFTNGIGPDPEATQSIAEFFDAVEASGTSYVYTESGSGLGEGCGTDCDCGHCNYCEDGVCRYGGEGPYGCYRGCS